MNKFSPIDPATLAEPDKRKLLAIYGRLCPHDRVTDDDPRRDAIAAEVFDVGNAPTMEEALSVIAWWGQSSEWARDFVRSARASFCRLKLECYSI